MVRSLKKEKVEVSSAVYILSTSITILNFMFILLFLICAASP